MTGEPRRPVDHDQLPDYDDLPPAPDGGRCAWGLFGAEDQLGLVA